VPGTSKIFVVPRLLELRDATVVLGGSSRVLDSLSISIDVGEHTAILGPNGAGKSTLIRLITIQLYPLAGASDVPPLRLFGRERWDVFELRSQLGIVSPDLHDRFVHGNAAGQITGRDAVVSGFFASQGLFANHRVTADMRDRAAAALDLMGVAHLASATLGTMSTGEARRVLIARALVREPKALVLDEPPRGLDLVARHHFLERIRAIARRGVTILLVTHHAEEIIPEIDRVILLARGRVAADGTKAQVLTAACLSGVFGAPLAVDESGGYYRVDVAGAPWPVPPLPGNSGV
jgi:iron complex transport system ATP-binding protein